MSTAVTTRQDTGIRVSHTIIAVIVAAALVIQLLVLFNGGQDANSGESTVGQPMGIRLWRLFSYFTIQSNLFVLVVAIGLALRPDREGTLWRIVRLDSLIGIVITGLVFDIVLAQYVHLSGWSLVATIGFHYLSPWLTLLAWLLFGPRPRMTWGVVGLAFIWPILWLVYTFVVGAIDGFYPYPFIDVVEIGYAASLRNAAVILVFGIGLAALLKTLDKHLPVLGARR